MKKGISLLIVSGLFIAGCSFGKDKVPVKKNISGESQSYTMTVTKGAFTPAALKLRVGDRVVFFNEDEALHQISLGDKGGIPLQEGASWTYAFDSAGTFEVKDLNDKSFKATITVSP